MCRYADSIFRAQQSGAIISVYKGKAINGALCRIKGQAAAPFPDKSSSRFAASVFIGKTLYPTASPPTDRPKGKK